MIALVKVIVIAILRLYENLNRHQLKRDGARAKSILAVDLRIPRRNVVALQMW